MAKYSYQKRDEIHTLKFLDILQETEKGWRVLFDETRPDGSWLPKRKVEIDTNDNTIQVPNWLIEEHDLDGYVTS